MHASLSAQGAARRRCGFTRRPGDWSLALWKKSYDQLRQHIKKQSHCFAKEVHLVKAMVFLVVMYGCESWTIKEAER